MLSDAAIKLDTSSWHASSRRLLGYWTSIHPSDGRLPGRQHFDPTQVAMLLPNIVLVDVHRLPSLRFRYRLLGTRLDAVIGEPLAGRWLDQVYARDPGARALLDAYAAVARSGRPNWRRGDPYVGSDPLCREVEVLRLPLASDGTVVDLILGLTMYFDAARDPVVNRRGLSCGAAEIVDPRSRR